MAICNLKNDVKNVLFNVSKAGPVSEKLHSCKKRRKKITIKKENLKNVARLGQKNLFSLMHKESNSFRE